MLLLCAPVKKNNVLRATRPSTLLEMEASQDKGPVRITSITYLSDLAEVNPENDNVDVHIAIDDGRQLTFTVATPNNVFWCMENEGIDYHFGEPMIFVKNLTRENVERALRKIVEEDNGRWLSLYGS
jgi:hypothetical protein